MIPSECSRWHKQTDTQTDRQTLSLWDLTQPRGQVSTKKLYYDNIFIRYKKEREAGAHHLISSIFPLCNEEGEELCSGLWLKREEGVGMALIPATRIFPLIC